MASDGLTLKIYSVSFFGHRVVNTPRQIEQKLDKLIQVYKDAGGAVA